MKRANVVALALAAAVLGGAFAGFAENPSPSAGEKCNPALVHFGRAIILYVSFDGHEKAEITLGNPVPQGDAKWVEETKNPAALYVPGLYGQGLKSGDYALTYGCTNAVLGTTGAFALWIKPESLHHTGTYYWPVHLFAQGYSVMFGRMGDPRNKELLYVHLAGVSAICGSMADWKPGEWRLVVVNWDRTGIEISSDGNIPVRASLKMPIESDAISGFRVSFAGANEDAFIFDELMVLDIPLKENEIRRLFEEGKQ